MKKVTLFWKGLGILLLFSMSSSAQIVTSDTFTVRQVSAFTNFAVTMQSLHTRPDSSIISGQDVTIRTYLGVGHIFVKVGYEHYVQNNTSVTIEILRKDYILKVVVFRNEKTKSIHPLIVQEFVEEVLWSIQRRGLEDNSVVLSVGWRLLWQLSKLDTTKNSMPHPRT